MGVTSYYSFGGEILGEETGGVRRDYLTDALGSVTATVTGTGTVENTYRYKPYGEQLAKTGTGSDPKFLWNGKSGYRQPIMGTLIIYIRARHYVTISGKWTSIDPLWISKEKYIYASGSVTNLTDPSGLKPCSSDCCKDWMDEMNQYKIHCSNGSWSKDPPTSINQPCKYGQDICKQINDRLRRVILPECHLMCNQVLPQPPKPGQPVVPPKGGYPDNSSWAAASKCCTNSDGTEQKCLIWCREPDESKNPCINQCLKLHEERHLLQPWWGCKGKRPLPKSINQPDVNKGNWGECDAYKAELNCLIGKMKKIGCTIDKDLFGSIKTCGKYYY